MQLDSEKMPICSLGVQGVAIAWVHVLDSEKTKQNRFWHICVDSFLVQFENCLQFCIWMIFCDRSKFKIDQRSITISPICSEKSWFWYTCFDFIACNLKQRKLSFQYGLDVISLQTLMVQDYLQQVNGRWITMQFDPEWAGGQLNPQLLDGLLPSHKLHAGPRRIQVGTESMPNVT